MSTQPGVRYANSDNMTTEVYYQGNAHPLARPQPQPPLPRVGRARGGRIRTGEFRALCRHPLQGLHDETTGTGSSHKTYAGEDYTVRIDENFPPRHKLYALAGVNYFLADNISLGVNGSFGNRQSVQLQFNISF